MRELAPKFFKGYQDLPSVTERSGKFQNPSHTTAVFCTLGAIIYIPRSLGSFPCVFPPVGANWRRVCRVAPLEAYRSHMQSNHWVAKPIASDAV